MARKIEQLRALRWAKKHRTEFYKIAARLIPTEFVGANEDGERVVRIVHDAR